MKQTKIKQASRIRDLTGPEFCISESSGYIRIFFPAKIGQKIAWPLKFRSSCGNCTDFLAQISAKEKSEELTISIFLYRKQSILITNDQEILNFRAGKMSSTHSTRHDDAMRHHPIFPVFSTHQLVHF